MNETKIKICDALVKEPMTIAQLMKVFDSSKNKIYYNLKNLESSGHVKLTTFGYHNKVYSLTGKEYAQTSNVRVYLNSVRPASDYAWQSKKHSGSSMQSGMQGWELE